AGEQQGAPRAQRRLVARARDRDQREVAHQVTPGRVDERPGHRAPQLAVRDAPVGDQRARDARRREGGRGRGDGERGDRERPREVAAARGHSRIRRSVHPSGISAHASTSVSRSTSPPPPPPPPPNQPPPPPLSSWRRDGGEYDAVRAGALGDGAIAVSGLTPAGTSAGCSMILLAPSLVTTRVRSTATNDV